VGEAHAHAGDELQRLFHPPTAYDLALQRLRFVEQRHQTRLELVGQEFLRRADVEDRRRPLVETGPDHVEHRVCLAALGRCDGDDAAVGAAMYGRRPRQHIRRQRGIARTR